MRNQNATKKNRPFTKQSLNKVKMDWQTKQHLKRTIRLLFLIWAPMHWQTLVVTQPSGFSSAISGLILTDWASLERRVNAPQDTHNSEHNQSWGNSATLESNWILSLTVICMNYFLYWQQYCSYQKKSPKFCTIYFVVHDHWSVETGHCCRKVTHHWLNANSLSAISTLLWIPCRCMGSLSVSFPIVLPSSIIGDEFQHAIEYVANDCGCCFVSVSVATLLASCCPCQPDVRKLICMSTWRTAA